MYLPSALALTSSRSGQFPLELWQSPKDLGGIKRNSVQATITGCPDRDCKTGGHSDQRDAQDAKALTLDEARDEAQRIASNIAKLPSLVSKRLEIAASGSLAAVGFFPTIDFGLRDIS